MKKTPAKRNSSGIWILLVLLVAVIAAVAAWFYLRGKPQEKPGPAPLVDSLPKQVADTTFGHPRDPQNRPIYRYTGFTLAYDEAAEQAAWVAYWLNSNRLRRSVERTDEFKPDPRIQSGSATPEDYRRSGYDRGHLAPAGDMVRSERTMRESFYMSNMSPQVPEFNRGIWERAESRVRTWTRAYEKLYIVTGPVLTDAPLEKIGANEVWVPRRYYKVVFDAQGPEVKMLAFLMENRELKGGPKRYVVPVDSVERVTGLDFFWQLPDSLEDALECCPRTELWSWTNEKQKRKQDPYPYRRNPR